jgi:type VI secretion system protein ImpJ
LYPDTRYIAETRVIPDENTGGDERPVQIARKTMRLLLDTESSEGLATLPLARVIRDGAGHFIYDPRFVPPVLQIQASPRLMLLSRRLIEIMDEKSSAIGFRRAGDSQFTPAELANLWLRHTINFASASLRHLLTAKRGHPEELFIEFSRLAGALCTFKLGSHPRSLPAYDHRSPSGCFEALDRHIREHLEITVPTNCLTIPLRSDDGSFYDGQISDSRCLGRSRWVLAVRSPLGDGELMTKTPQLVKVCSSRFVRELVKRALPGLPLTYLPVPPAAISGGVDSQYFTISRTGPSWEHMVHTRSIGVYVPGDIPSPEVAVHVVLENS